MVAAWSIDYNSIAKFCGQFLCGVKSVLLNNYCHLACCGRVLVTDHMGSTRSSRGLDSFAVAIFIDCWQPWSFWGSAHCSRWHAWCAIAIVCCTIKWLVSNHILTDSYCRHLIRINQASLILLYPTAYPRNKSLHLTRGVLWTHRLLCFSELAGRSAVTKTESESNREKPLSDTLQHHCCDVTWIS